MARKILTSATGLSCSKENHKEPLCRVLCQPTFWIGPPWLPVPGIVKRKRKEFPRGKWSLHSLCTDLHLAVTDCSSHIKSLIGQCHYPLWVTTEDSIWQRKRLSEWTDYYLCRLTGSKKLWTSWYHPQTKCQCERFISTFINMLGCDQKSESLAG